LPRHCIIFENKDRAMPNTHYYLIEQALQFIEEQHLQQPGLDEIAAHLDVSPFHLQRVFSEWVGISPKRFLQFLTARHARELLRHSRSVLDATYDSGLSSPGRLHDLFVQIDAVTPGEYKKMGAGMTITCGAADSPFGPALLALTNRGICYLGFGDADELMADVSSRYPLARLLRNDQATADIHKSIFEREKAQPLPLFIKGTNFQIKVWEALLKIPEGCVASYSDIAKMIGRPGASRAVGSAVGANPVSYLIPCHRVIREMGLFGDYHWGSTRKKALLLYESEHAGAGKEKLAG